jgi:hypothetical protein
MIRLSLAPLVSIDDARKKLQTAIGVEFGTLPPYLYALYSIRPGTNSEAAALIRSVALQEMIHMCLACNILNALGGDPKIAPMTYPGPLPGDIGPEGQRLTLHLLPFSPAAMQQAMKIEEPEHVPPFPVVAALAAAPAGPVTIGQFYRALDAFLATLPASDWQANRNQISDDQFFAGQIYPVQSYPDAHKAIDQIVSEGEGAADDPLDFQDQLAHYFRFGEIFNGKALTKIDQPPGYQWGPTRFPVDWAGAYPAIADPGLHNFSHETPEARAAQAACDKAFSAMIEALQRAVRGASAALGEAVAAMFALRRAAGRAFETPLADRAKVAGPRFVYPPH